MDLTGEKGEAVLISNFRKNNDEVVSKSTVRYLGMTSDVKLNFTGHLDYSRERQMAKMMTDIRGRKSSRRLLIVEMARCIRLYVVHVRAGALDNTVKHRRVSSTSTQ